jgi:photosystem II stability/assembly factor-like uncharacterized protein
MDAWLTLDRGTLLHSTDGGRDWGVGIAARFINPGVGEVGPVQFVNRTHGWVAGQAGPLPMIYRTVDGGRHWARTFLR